MNTAFDALTEGGIRLAFTVGVLNRTVNLWDKMFITKN